MPSPVEDLAESGRLPDGTPVRILSHRSVRSAAHMTGLSLRRIEIQALRLEIVPDRYLRNMNTLDCAAQARLLSTTVAMVGLGGLGGSILEGLARLGFGIIQAADHDIFEATNLNRQLLATDDTLGGSKAAAARARVELVNPAVELNVRQNFVNPGDFADFYRGADIAIDALGGMSCRPAAQSGAAKAGVPLISACVAGWTAMASTVLPGGQGLTNLFCQDGAASGPAAEDALGCLVPAIYVASGLVLAEAVRLALGQPPKLGGPEGKLTVVDLGTMDWERFTLRE
jgi:molybdopterin/thiamine biosynthesis adenylyltransferase